MIFATLPLCSNQLYITFPKSHIPIYKWYKHYSKFQSFCFVYSHYSNCISSLWHSNKGLFALNSPIFQQRPNIQRSINCIRLYFVLKRLHIYLMHTAFYLIQTKQSYQRLYHTHQWHIFHSPKSFCNFISKH